jgi:hypothetical protein
MDVSARCFFSVILKSDTDFPSIELEVQFFLRLETKEFEEKVQPDEECSYKDMRGGHRSVFNVHVFEGSCEITEIPT